MIDTFYKAVRCADITFCDGCIVKMIIDGPGDALGLRTSTAVIFIADQPIVLNAGSCIVTDTKNHSHCLEFQVGRPLNVDDKIT